MNPLALEARLLLRRFGDCRGRPGGEHQCEQYGHPQNSLELAGTGEGAMPLRCFAACRLINSRCRRKAHPRETSCPRAFGAGHKRFVRHPRDRQNCCARADIASAVPSGTSMRAPRSSGATKYSLAIPRSEGFGPVTTAPTVAPTVVIFGATGRTERTFMTIAGSDWANSLQPLKVLPLHSSQDCPSGILTLRTVNTRIDCEAPATEYPAPLKLPLG